MVKNRTLSGLLTVFNNCENLELQSGIVCRPCILNRRMLVVDDFTICNMIGMLKLTNKDLILRGI